MKYIYFSIKGVTPIRKLTGGLNYSRTATLILKYKWFQGYISRGGGGGRRRGWREKIREG